MKSIFGSKVFTRAIWLVSLVSLFTDIASEMLYPVMPLYLKSIGFSVVLIGVLEGIAEATAGISKGYFGQLSDSVGKRVSFIRWGYTLSALSKPLMAIFTYPWWVFIARTTDRLGKGIRTSARDALLSDETVPEHKGKVFGLHRGMDTTGAAIGPLLALFFLMNFPDQYRWLFFLALLPGMVAVGLTYLLKEKSPERVPAKAGSIHFFSFLGYWKKSSMGYKKLIIGLLLFTLFNSSDVFLLLRTQSVLGSDRQMILFYVFYNLIYAMAAFPIGRLADKIGLKVMLIIGLFIFAFVYLGMGQAERMTEFGILFLLYGIYAACTEGVSKAMISNIADKKDTATALGFYNSFYSVITLLASTLAGILWYSFSPSVMFTVSSAGALLAIFFLLFLGAGNNSPKKALSLH